MAHPYDALLLLQAAQFRSPRTGEAVQVSAHLHDISDFLRGGLKAGLQLVEADDWRDQGAVSTDPPRLFSTLWEKEAKDVPQKESTAIRRNDALAGI